MRALVVVAVLGPLAAACSDPTFDVAIEYEQLAGVAAADQLAEQVATLTVSVVDAVSAGPAAGLGREATCDDVAFGRIPEDVLEGARRASVGALDTPHLSGVPRLGQKLVIVEARAAGGRRVGGGCTKIGDVESDTTVDVLVEVAPRARVFTREEVTDEPTPINLVVTAAWNDLLVLGGRKVVAELHSTGGVIEMVADATLDNGLTRTPDFSLTDPGPAQTLIRVRWAEDFIRVPAFVQWPAMPVLGNANAHFTLAADDGSRLGRSWVSGVIAFENVTTWSAAALQKRATMPEELAVVRYIGGRLAPVPPISVPGTRAMALWNGALYTVTDNGWHTIDANGLSPQPIGTAAGFAAATEIHAFDGCEGAPASGLLVRRRESSNADAVDRFYAYDSPGIPSATGSPLANLAAALVPGNVEIVGDACVDLGDTPVRIVATRESLGLVAYLSTSMMPAKLTNVQNATSFVREETDTALLAAAEGNITGPRVRSYRLASLPINGNTSTGFVAVDDVDTELATLPLALVVGKLDSDERYDVLAALPSLGGPRLQASFGREVAGESLASVSPPLLSGRAGTNPILRLENVDRMFDNELVVMTDEGLDVFCFNVRAGTNGMMECVSAP
jgi:hypothetical protein